MSASTERKDEENRAMMPARMYENFFDSFRRQMEGMMKQPRSFPTEIEFPSLFEARDMRMALYDLVDKGDRFELHVEVPGLEKEKIDVKATKYSVEISGKHSETTEEKGKRYVYAERLYRSFYRSVPLPEEIMPSKVAAKLESGILKVDLPKKTPTKGESEATRVDVK